MAEDELNDELTDFNEDLTFPDGEGMEYGEEGEEMTLLTSQEDAEHYRRYKEYLNLLKQIEAQNKIVEDLKGQIIELCRRSCKGRCEMRQIKHLHAMMEQENLKLRCLIRKAMELQCHGSKRRYRSVPIATTITEDQMAACYIGCSAVTTDGKGTCEDDSQESSSCPDKQDEEPNMADVTKALKKIKVCCPSDKKLIDEIACMLMKSAKEKDCDPCGGGKGGRKPQQRPCGANAQKSKQPPCGGMGGMASGAMGRTGAVGNFTGTCGGVGGPGGGQNLNQLKNKIKCMQSNVNKLMKEISKREGGNNGCDPCGNMGNNTCQDSESDDCNLGDQMTIGAQAKQTCQPQSMAEVDPILACGGNKNSKSTQLEKMKQNYLTLLNQYEKKSVQCQEMEKRMKAMSSGCKGDGNGNGSSAFGGEGAEAELSLLRERVIELKEEQAEYKCLIKEQATQLEDYRQKYLLAQQTVEEQCVMMEKLSMNNKRIEKQINQEVKDIRAKFQEKLNDLMHLPKLLENEQIKLAQCCKEKEELQAKLALVCKELKQIKESNKASEKNDDCRPKLLSCTLELEKCKSQVEELTRQRDLFCEQLTTTQDDLDTLRSESAKIIARTKERTELMKQQMQEQIDKLERELAQCRATATLSVTDREAVIREMQGQLNTLSYSFDAAQKQIKTLRNHIAYVSNENCYPVKC